MEREQPALTTVHLVRHASHGLLGRVLTGRMPAVPLSEAGRAEAASLAEAFRAHPIAAVLCSPVQRARETADPIAAALGLSVTEEPGWDEIDFGRWTGATFAALDNDPAWRRWNHHRDLAACPDGESMLAAQARAVAALLRAADAYPDGEVVAVSHQDVLKAVLAHCLGMPLGRLECFSLDPASRSVVTLFPGGGARVDAMNLPLPG